MKKKKIQVVRKISEDIDTLNLNDQDSWLALATELQAVVGEDVDGQPEINALLTRCAQGIQAVADKTATDRFALVDALVDALASAEAVLDNGDGVEGLSTANAALAKVLNPDDPGADVQAVTVLSVDDVAALLVQAEPDDVEALQQVADALAQFKAGDGCPPDGQSLVVEAVELLETLMSGVSDDPDADLTKIGQLLEAVMAMVEGGSAANPATMDPPPSVPDTSVDARAVSSLGTEAEAFSSTDSVPVAAEAMDYMPEDPDLELLGEFVTEGIELIASAEDALLTLENDPEDMDAVGMVFRAFHTVKGTAAFMDLTLIAEMGHHAESLFSRVRDREIRYSGGYADLSLRALDMIKELVLRVQNALGGKPLQKPSGYDELMRVLENPEATGVSEESDDISSEMPLPRLGDILVARGKADRKKVEALASETSEQPLGMRLVNTQAATLEDVGQALRSQRQIKSPAKTVETSIRVGTSRLDRLIDMVGELVIAHSMVSQDEVVISSNHHDLLKKVSHTSKIVRELQGMSMSMRMVPLKGTFSKMARLVRDLARKVGKNVKLVTEGEETEIDRNLVDIISDPLVHMVRNSVDHGIELPEGRLSSGKPEYGTVSLSAYHSAGSVVVEIRDDGRGLNRDVILAKAREKGLVAEGTTPSDREIYNLVFEPGFSTAEAVTDVSGRGVGMDVVKKNIESLRGQVEINSVMGQGSVFKITLPLTLAIIDGMVVRVGPETYVIPTVSIVRSIKPARKDISTVMDRGKMLSLQGNLIPLFRLADLYSIAGAEEDFNRNIVVVVEDDTGQVGLIIDELVGRQQVVIKSLGEAMRNIPGISGGAIMPNGRVGLILDVGELTKFANAGAEEMMGKVA
ncbi:MAG: chemotaxis protein CheA [Desulfobacterales bacterium]|nr:chemotaxis protein CheA [Desulfobacterales bacterium]